MFRRRLPKRRMWLNGVGCGSGDQARVAGATGGSNPPADLNRVFWRQLSIIGSSMGTRAELVALVRLVEASGLRPVLDETFPLAETRAALY